MPVGKASSSTTGWPASSWSTATAVPSTTSLATPCPSCTGWCEATSTPTWRRSEEHTSELQSRENLVCRLLLEKKNKKKTATTPQQKKQNQYLQETRDHHASVYT